MVAPISILLQLPRQACLRNGDRRRHSVCKKAAPKIAIALILLELILGEHQDQ